MKPEKIGSFIKNLRKKQNLTQEELAKLIPIGREAVSKWENGKTIPDSSVLIKLSEIFDVSINEILYGEKITKNNHQDINKITLSLYNSNNKKRRFLIFLLIFTLILSLSFLAYYFISNYKAVKVYTITGENKEGLVYNGLFINTKEKVYFRLDPTIDENIKSLTLYYKKEDNKKKLIYQSDGDSINIIDYYGYEDYFDLANIDYIIKNLYVDIKTENIKRQTIKLTLVRDYVNENLFFKKRIKASEKNTTHDSKTTNKSNMQLINCIKQKFTIDEDNSYRYEEQENTTKKNYLYVDIAHTLYLDILNDNDFKEKWTYYINYNFLEYTSNKDSFSFENNKIKCNRGNCENSQEKIDKFWNEFNKGFNCA